MIWEAKQHQLDGADEAFAVLKDYGLVYLSWEERTGKSITDLVIAEKCPTVEKVLVVTKKKALDGWYETLKNFKHEKYYHPVNYHSVGKVKGKFDLVILDEAHSNISGYPKRSKIWTDVREKTQGLPIIYNSATAHAQGYQLLFNQFALSDWSPWKRFPDFYEWFKYYAIRDKDGKLPTTRISPTQSVPDYTMIREQEVLASVKHLFTIRTRVQLGFEHEPEDQLHYIELDKKIKDIYNELVTKKLLAFTHSETGKEYILVCDVPIKLRFALHMLEGGTLKINDDYINLGNNEKADYIMKTWGDTNDLVIMYQYIADRIKLERMFKKAKILQSTSYAEGIDLSMYKHLVIYSQDFSTARHTQRRARQANMSRTEEIKVHYLLVRKGVSEMVYKTVSINKKNYVDTVFERI